MSVLLPYEITLFSNIGYDFDALNVFYYLMKLHYSQTTPNLATFLVVVLLPYEITLFSNKGWRDDYTFYVLLPYEITLFSNNIRRYIWQNVFYYLMKLHYSQTNMPNGTAILSFYYLMKLHYSQTEYNKLVELTSFTTLWNYTILKQILISSQA